MRPRSSALVSAFVVGSVVLIALPLRGAPARSPAASSAVEGAMAAAPVSAPATPVQPAATPVQPAATEPLASGPLEPVQIVSQPWVTPAVEPVVTPAAPTASPAGPGASSAMSNLPSVTESLAASTAATAPTAPAMPSPSPSATPVTTAVPISPPPQTETPSSIEWRQQALKALHDYNTDGARVLAVPTEGPAGEYFSNGAELLSGPSSVIPEDSFDVNFDMPAQPSP